jgi:hypothetical protein
VPLSPSEFRTKLTKADFKSLEALERRGSRKRSGEVLPFRRRYWKWRSKVQRWRMPVAVGLVVALVAGAGIGSLIFDLHSQGLSFGGIGPCRWGLQRTCVIDGDTIRYKGEKIRLAGIDTPEIFSPKCSHELELGRRAK